MRETSIETYHAIKENGLLSRMRFVVYECIYNHQPLTQSEAWSFLKISHGIKSGQNITPRFAELKNHGVITESGVRPCKITGRNCIEWQTTNNLPIKFERKTKDQIIKELENEIISLKLQLNKQMQFKLE